MTNACPAEDFFQNMVTNGKFLYSSFYGFTNEDIRPLPGAGGVSVKDGEGDSGVFPVSDKSSDVIRAFSRCLDRLG